MSSHVDPSARFEADRLGTGSRVMAFVNVGSEVVIGDRCLLHEHSLLLGPIVLEAEVEVHAGAQLLGEIHVEQGVSVGAGAVVGAESGLNSGDGGAKKVLLRRFASIGTNATVVPGIVIGRRAVVGAGAVVTDNVPANAIVSGNPATIISYVNGGADKASTDPAIPPVASREIGPLRVGSVSLERVTTARDLRGSLAAAEFAQLPFAPRRLFTVYDVPSESVRGAHAHRECSQFLICLAGSVSCLVDDGVTREEIRLASPSVGLFIPPMIWGTQWRYSRDAILLVLASHPYDPADYIRDYEEFLAALEAEAGSGGTVEA